MKVNYLNFDLKAWILFITYSPAFMVGLFIGYCVSIFLLGFNIAYTRFKIEIGK